MTPSRGASVRRRTIGLLAAAGLSAGVAGGIAYGHAYSEHSANGWHHGIDGSHVFMSTTTNANREGVVAWIYRYYSGVWIPDQHSEETRYTSNHVHVNGCHAWDCDTTAGHISSPNPYLGHHSHP